MNRLSDMNASWQILVKGVLLVCAAVIALGPYVFADRPAAIFGWGFAMIAAAVAVAALAMGTPKKFDLLMTLVIIQSVW